MTRSDHDDRYSLHMQVDGTLVSQRSCVPPFLKDLKAFPHAVFLPRILRVRECFHHTAIESANDIQRDFPPGRCLVRAAYF